MTRDTNDQLNSTTALGMRLRFWALDRVATYRASGQLDKSAALTALDADESYYLAPADEQCAAMVWRKLAAILGDRKRPANETAYVTATFCEDALNARCDASYLDRASGAWRAAGERFVPTFGQLAKVADEAKLQSGRHHLQALRRVIDPPRIAGNLGGPAITEKPSDDSMTLEQTLDCIAKMRAQKTSGLVDRDGREPRQWGRVDELFLRGLHARRDAFQEAGA